MQRQKEGIPPLLRVKKITIYNRKKAMNQKEDSLEEFRAKYTQKHVSQLKVLKGIVKFQDRSHYSFEKGIWSR